MAFNLKLPGFFGNKAGANQIDSATTVMEGVDAVPVNKPAFGLGVFGRYSVNKQLQILGAILGVAMLIIAIVVYVDNQRSADNTVYVATAGEMGMISQRLAKASTLAMQGDPFAFDQLNDSHAKFSGYLKALTEGGELFDRKVDAPDVAKAELSELSKAWADTDKNAGELDKMRNTLIVIGIRSRSYVESNQVLFDLAEQVADLKLQIGAPAREVAMANQVFTLSQRVGKNIIALRTSDEVNKELASQVASDTKRMGQLIAALSHGDAAQQVSAPTDGEVKRKLGEIEEAFSIYKIAVDEILDGMEGSVLAKQAGSSIFRDSEGLLQATSKLAKAYQGNIAHRAAYGTTLAVLIVIVLLSLVLMAKIYIDDTRRRAEQAEQSRQATESVNRQNQDAILRLMNELGDLADGDLTVTATVSEDITGAIADSINYTVEELRVLVGRINDAAGRVTLATETAQQTSAELLAAAELQSKEIQDAGRSVLSMASSMTAVSGNATQSAQVARQSLAAANKGTQAVQDSIKGMNEIREQIQETSKRIKRLGESSQEIGEIVELISDITEQTNVLALNAAIQAASAGDAGRGFTVVAEEVQRLAERSGEATKQIAAIVKTIQTDTQGAVSAMEESTRGVVEGAKLSDAAGQALAEIGDVSQSLAQLIESISDATQQQADSATSVAGKMQDILRVTEQTTAGTQKTATAVGELAGLATELKGSVAGFKVG